MKAPPAGQVTPWLPPVGLNVPPLPCNGGLSSLFR